MSEETATQTERRARHRQRVLKGALVVFGHHEHAFDCLIRNLNEGGAKLTLESTRGIPAEFELLIPAEARIAPAKAVWRNEREIGARFTGPWRASSRRG